MKRLGWKFWGWIGALACVLGIAGAILGYEIADGVREARVQKGLAENLIRLHVRANSDDEADQKIKMAVKEGLVEYLKELFSDFGETEKEADDGGNQIDKTREVLVANMSEIRENALGTLKELECEADVAVYFENCFFAERVYGDITLPAGVYETFRVDIGDAAGQNWWCVLYPPISFEDSSAGIVSDESRQALKNILTEDEYNAITKKRTYRFKYLKFLNR